MTDETTQSWWRSILRPRFFTPRGFRIVAATLLVAFLACHLAGLRSYTCVLCGQAPTGDPADPVAFSLGALYLILYAGFAIGAPILALASLLFQGIDWALSRRRQQS